MISAEIVTDSISPEDYRLTTFRLRYPRFIHSELMTHRVFSRNASSSRAVPVKKMIEEASDPALRAAPARWVKEEPGMQGYTDLIGAELLATQQAWLAGALSAVGQAEVMVRNRAHKQHINRMLEPYLHINVVVTSTDFMNFFGLRLDSAADPTLQALAKAMWVEYLASTPRLLQPGEWHLPFVNMAEEDVERGRRHDVIGWNGSAMFDIAKKVSVARCARTSYTSFATGKRSTVEEDLALYEKLMGQQPLHASPAEHQATPDARTSAVSHGTVMKLWQRPEQHGNFTGWRQFRKMLPGENIAPLPMNYQES